MACHSQVFLTFAWSASGWKLVHPTSNGSPSRLQRLVVNSPSAADVTRKSGSPKNAAVRLNSSPVFRLAMMYPKPNPMYGSSGLSGRKRIRPLRLTGISVIVPTGRNVLLFTSSEESGVHAQQSDGLNGSGPQFLRNVSVCPAIPWGGLLVEMAVLLT